jgi:hypothetical protein
MRTRTIITALAVGALVVTPALVSAQQSGNRNSTEAKQRAQVERVQRDIDRDRVRERAGVAEHDRDRTQDRTNAPEDAKQAQQNIYGYNLMSDEERDAYRERIRNASNEQEREQLMAQHREEIQTRARNRNIKIDESGNPVRED